LIQGSHRRLEKSIGIAVVLLSRVPKRVHFITGESADIGAARKRIPEHDQGLSTDSTLNSLVRNENRIPIPAPD
jgi:hypothetical protein